MSGNGEQQQNTFKRKRKKSFLKNARKYAKKGHFGCGSQLEGETYQYFVKIMEVYREGFENDEDKRMFVENVFQQTENQEIQCCCNQIGCRVIEMLLPFSSDDVMKRYMECFGKELRPLCSDKFASHVLEELVTQSCKRSFENNDMKEEYKDFTLKISKFLLNNLEDFIWDTYGNHIIRTCLQILSNIPKEDPKLKDFEKKKIEKELGDTFIDPVYADVVIEYGERILTWPQFPDLCKNDKSSGFLQILLRALKNVSPKLLKKYMKKLLECFTPENENLSDPNKLLPVFLSTSSLMVLEVFLLVAPMKYFTQIYLICFAGRLLKLSKIRNTNFAVQKLINRCEDKSQFESIFDELADHFYEIIKEGHTGVIWAIADGCKRLLAKQGPFINSIMKSLNCFEPETRQSSIVMCLARMKTFDEISTSNLSNEDLQKSRLNLHGTLILQILLEFNKPIKIVNSMLEIETNTLKALLSNTMGSHIVDSFVRSTFVGEKSREKLVRKMKGTYQDLAATKFGSRSFETIWNAAGLKHKMAIMDELCYKDGLWSNTDHGKIISSKVHLPLYKKNKEEWKKSFSNKKNDVLELLKEVVK